MTRRARRAAVLAAAAAGALATLSACGGDTTVTVAVTVHTGTTSTGGAGTGGILPTTPTTPTTTTRTSTGGTGTGTTTTSTDGIVRPAGFPDTAEKELLDRLDADIPARCTRTSASNTSAGASASVYCDLVPSDGVRVYFESFPTVAAMNRIYTALRRSQSAAPGVRRCDRAGLPLPGEGSWNTTSSSAERGRVLCFKSRGVFWYVWTQNDVRAMGWANGAGRSRVRSFWVNRSTIRR